MSYITPGDYRKSIQADNLTQIIGNSMFVLDEAIELAIEDVKSGLVQKYQTEREFADVTPFDQAQAYKGLDRVYLDAPVFNSATTYTAGQLISYQPSPASPDRFIYRAISGAGPGVFIANQWAQISYQYQVFSPVIPAPEFQYNEHYQPGEQVFYNDRIYTAKADTICVFPDNPNSGAYFWGAGVPFEVPAGTPITDALWSATDPRTKQLVWAVVAISLYYVHSRIAPRNIPELRENDFKKAWSNIKKFAEGDLTPKTAMKQPRQGHRIRYGGQPKNQNRY